MIWSYFPEKFFLDFLWNIHELLIYVILIECVCNPHTWYFYSGPHVKIRVSNSNLLSLLRGWQTSEVHYKYQNFSRARPVSGNNGIR